MVNNSVLIVDDTPVNLKLVRVLLTRQGFDVRTANTAEEALELVQSFRPPGIGGRPVTRHEWPGNDAPDQVRPGNARHHRAGAHGLRHERRRAAGVRRRLSRLHHKPIDNAALFRRLSANT